MSHSVKVLIIVPAYNEEESLPKLLQEIKSHGYDVVVVNDASADSTFSVAVGQGVSVLSLAANLGIGGAVQTGFKYAAKNSYDIVVQIDGDGQHDPVWLDAVVDPIRRGEADCVIG